MGFTPLFQTKESLPPEGERRPAVTTKSKPKTKTKAKKNLERGCNVCPLNDVPGLVKILPKIKGKDLLVVAQSPGQEENEQGIELVGKSGQFFWGELGKVGIQREDVDVVNAVKCLPANVIEGSYSSRLEMRSPTPEEIRCCSIHTETAIGQSKAKYILVLGQVAQKALLNTRSLPSQKIFYSQELRAKVYLLDHPSFFIRSGCTNETPNSTNSRLSAFRNTLQMVSSELGQDPAQITDEFSYLKKQKYYIVKNSKQAQQAESIIRQYAKSGQRVSFDVENYVDEGRQGIICCGISPKPGLAFVFVLEHRDVDQKYAPDVTAILRDLLADKEIKKSAQWGCSDIVKLKQALDIDVHGFDFDTMYGGYFKNPDQKMRKHGLSLDDAAEYVFPQFSGYKGVAYQDMLKGATNVPEKVLGGNSRVKKAYIKRHGLYDIRKLSLDTLRMYNGGDCDITKRWEIANRKAGPKALMKLYIDVSFVLYRMEGNGPLFNYEQNVKLAVLYPAKEAKYLQALREALNDPKYNPASPPQVSKAVYQTLGLTYPGRGKPNTQKTTLLMLAKHHPFPQLQIDWRKAMKANGTYVVGFRRCADLNGGRLKTKWKLHGTATGRLSSGGDKDDEGLVNLQNIPKDPQMRNMLIADKRWREVYDFISDSIGSKKLEQDGGLWKKLCQRVEQWIQDQMPDLKTFMGFDFGQVEIRVVAQISGDKNLISDCLTSDIHTVVGMALTGWSADQIKGDKRIRTLTKNVHFGIVYGSSEDGTVDYVKAVSSVEDLAAIDETAKEMGLDSVEDFIRRGYRRYHKRYPGVRRFIEQRREYAREHKCSETIFGLRRPLVINEKHNVEEDYTEEGSSGRDSFWGNIAANNPIQGSAHQLMLCALVNLWRKPNKYRLLGTPELEIHDFLGFGVKVLDLQEAYKRAKYLLEKEALRTVKKDFPEIPEWSVPLVVEGEGGLRLGDQVELEEGFGIGDFLVRWYVKARKNEESLEAQLSEIM